jgi:hypothetical protein
MPLSVRAACPLPARVRQTLARAETPPGSPPYREAADG